MDFFLSIEAFVRVTEAKSFVSASRQLGVARSVVTTRVKQLEDHLGVVLLHRSARAVTLSDPGENYYRECVDLLQKVEKLSLRSHQEGVPLEGKLRVQVLPGFALGHFSKALTDFRNAHPKIEFQVTVSDRMADPIQEGLDLVLQIFPPHSNSLLEKRLFPVRKIFCAAPNYLEEEPVIETPLDLFKHDFACYSYYPWGEKWPFTKGGERFEVPLSPVLKTNSVHLLLDFARSGGGVACLPTMVAAADVLEHRLKRVLQDYTTPPQWLSAVYPESRRFDVRVKLFLDHLRESFPSEPQWDKALGLPPLEPGPDGEF